MPNKYLEDLARASAETSAMTPASRASCKNAREQIQFSRGVLEQSLDLLSRPYFALRD